MDLFLSLGSDQRRELVLEARINPGPAWPAGAMIGFAGPGSSLLIQTEVPFHWSGRRLHVLIEARGVDPGDYGAEIELRSRGTEEVLGTIPLRISIIPGKSVAQRWTGPTLIAFLAGGLVFFSWTSFAHSRFISREQLAVRLEPLRWTEAGDVDGVRDSAAKVKEQIERQMTWRDRARAWLEANPLAFGLPGRVYEETVGIQPGKRLERLAIYPIAKRHALRAYRENPSQISGCLMASAAEKSGLVVFAVPDNGGRVGGLVPRPELERGRLTELIQPVELLDSSSPADASTKLAGWRIRRRSHAL